MHTQERISAANVLQWRGITRKQAEYVGMAASVAGGFVAISGSMLWREPAPKLPRHADDYDYERHEYERHEIAENDGVRIQGGDYAGVSDGLEPFAAYHFVMAVSPKSGLASMGWSMPAELVERWLEANPEYADKLTTA